MGIARFRQSRWTAFVVLLAGCGDRQAPTDWQLQYDRNAEVALKLEGEASTLVESMTMGPEGDAIMDRITELDKKIQNAVLAANEAKAHGAVAPDNKSEILLLKSQIAEAKRLEQQFKSALQAIDETGDDESSVTSEDAIDIASRRFERAALKGRIGISSLDNTIRITTMSRRLRLLESLQ